MDDELTAYQRDHEHTDSYERDERESQTEREWEEADTRGE